MSRIRRPTAWVTGGAALAMLLGGAAYAATHAAADPVKAASVAGIAVVVACAILVAPVIEPAAAICAGLFMSIFSGQWSQLGIPLGLDRPLLLYGLFACALRLLPDARRRLRIRMNGLHWLLVAVAVYAIGSALFAGVIGQREPLFALTDRLGIIGFLLFATGPVVFAEQRNRDLLIKTLIGMGAYLGLMSFFQKVGPTSLVFPRYIMDPSVGITFDRARGPFVESGANGLAMFVCIVACGLGYARWPARNVRRVCVAVGALCAIGIVLTLTRQVWLGATVAILVTLATTASLRRLTIPAIAIGALGVLAALAFIPGLSASASSRTGDQSSLWDRLNSNRAAIAMIDDKPLLGSGWYRFATDSPPYYTQAATYPLTTVPRPHNVFLANAVELGLIGATAWLVALLLAIGGGVIGRAPPAFEPWRVALVAVAIDWLVVANFTPLGYAFANHVLWLFAGVAWARYPSAREGRAPRPVAASRAGALAAA